MGRLHLSLLVSCLSLFGIGVAMYKVVVLGFPIAPDQQMDVWIVEGHFSFNGTGSAAKLSAFVPDNSRSYLLEDESFVSQGFGMSNLKDGENRTTVWAIRKVTGLVDLYYRTVIRAASALGEGQKSKKIMRSIPKPDTVKLDGMALEAAQNLLSDISKASADTETFVRELLRRLQSHARTSHEEHLIGVGPESVEKTAQVACDILNLAGIPARVVRGISLKESASNLSLRTLLEVFHGDKWHLYNTASQEEESGNLFLPWFRGQGDLTTLTGGSGLKTRLSVQRLQEEAVFGALKVSRKAQPLVAALSLYRLPVEVQSVYRVMLMIPLGALLIVILRNVVGIKTLGTFMPVLIALSFRESEPLWGGILFCAIVAVSLLVRAYFEHLRLLLVPRLASVLTVIVLILVFTSLLLHRLGIEKGMSVALFPMVILTMFVERMSLAWDELGPRVAIRKGLLTMAVALLINYIISVRWISHLLFVFPELLLVLLSVNLLLGRYTGYRLLELKRFRSLASDLE